MDTFIVISVIFIIIFIWYKISSSYNAKVKQALDVFLSYAKPYSSLTELCFQVKTNNKKVNSWDKQHKIDFIINNNIKNIIQELEIFNKLKLWWTEEMPKAKQSTLNKAQIIASSMLFLGNSYQSRIKTELHNLIKKYNPENINFSLKTYTYHMNTRHYNPNTKEWWNDASPIEATFSTNSSPEKIIERIEILAKYDFQMTEYQYNCENQRKLMTNELKQQIIEKDNGICQICRKKCKPNEIEIDHIHPVSKGGKTTISNLQVLCVKCNRSKSNKWLEDVKESLNYNQKILEKETSTQDTEEKKYQNNYNKYAYLTTNERRVKIGDFVKFIFLDDNEESTYQIVEKFNNGSSKITASSPVGSALIGKCENDIVEATTPNGIIKLKIIKILEKD